MPRFIRSDSRAVPALLLAAVAAVLSACATGQGGVDRPAAAPAGAATPQSASFNTGRLVVQITDQNGANLDRATVDVTGEGGYRATGTTSRSGSVSFSGVPQVVNVSVIHQGGSYSHPFTVASNGSSEMRITMDIQEIEAPQASDTAESTAGPGGAGGF